MAGPQFAQTTVKFFVELHIILEAPPRRRWTRLVLACRPVFPRRPVLASRSFLTSRSSPLATTALLMTRRSGWPFGMWPLAQFRSLITRGTFRSCVLDLRLDFARRRPFDLRLEGDSRLRLWLRFRYPLHTKLAQHASPVVATLGGRFRRCWFGRNRLGRTRRGSWCGRCGGGFNGRFGSRRCLGQFCVGQFLLGLSLGPHPQQRCQRTPMVLLLACHAKNVWSKCEIASGLPEAVQRHG